MTTMTKRERDRRNINPHAEAIAAIFLYGNEYSQQNGGSMDFWDALHRSKKLICCELVEKIKAAPSSVATGE